MLNGVGGDTSIYSTIVARPVDHYKEMLLHSNHVFSSQDDLLVAIVHCLSQKWLILEFILKIILLFVLFSWDKALWPHEEVSTRNWRIESSEQLGCLVRHIAEFLLEPEPTLARTLTRVAINIALSTSSRHLAGMWKIFWLFF